MENCKVALDTIGFYTLYDERAKNAHPKSQMKRCEMIITEYCNFRCEYCRGLADVIYGNRRIKQLSLEEIKRNIDLWCDPLPLESIRFSGGEPTLHKDIREIVAYAKSKGIANIALSTNGSNKIELYKELVTLGVNDFSISLDACCATTGDMMAGDVEGSWVKVVNSIEVLSKLTYVTVGLVFTPDNIGELLDTIKYAHNLGVADIRIISSAQWNEPLTRLEEIPQEILDAHPILKYIVNNFLAGVPIRGISETDNHKCPLVMDDSVIAGSYHFPCIIYMREQGAAIGYVGPHMRQERMEWYENHDTSKDPICQKNCLDFCVHYHNRYKELHGG